MSSADILAFPHSEPFPPAQVLDLAVSVAIGRDLARSETEMFARHQRLVLAACDGR